MPQNKGEIKKLVY